MGLKEQKQLSDFLEEEKKLYKKREDVLIQQKEKMINNVVDEIKNYLQEEDFKVTDDCRGRLLATYNQIKVQVEYPKADDWFFGSHSVFKVSYEQKEKLISINFQKEYIEGYTGYSSSKEEELEKKIAFYKEHIPKLKALGVADLTGEYTIELTEKNPQGQRKTIPVKTIKEAINIILGE